jgi:hypothetical protein
VLPVPKLPTLEIKVMEVITKIIVTKKNIECEKKDEKERRHNYYLLNKIELNELSRRKKAERYANDPEYREKIKARRRENYIKEKICKVTNKLHGVNAIGVI